MIATQEFAENYIPQDLVDLQRWITIDRWEQIKPNEAYHAKLSKTCLNLEVDPYQAILTCEGRYWHFCTTEGGKYWTVYQVGLHGDSIESIQTEIWKLSSEFTWG